MLPPGTRLIAAGKWVDPTFRLEDKGVTFTFPDLPNQPTASQPLDIGFLMERPLADYPTRVTINYTSYFDQSVHNPSVWWGAFLLTTGNTNYSTFVSQLRGLGSGGITNLPFLPVGANTLIMNLDAKGRCSLSANGNEASSLLADNARSAMTKIGAMLIPGFAIRNHVMQQPFNKGDWFTVNSFKIEQMRPPLEKSSVAEIELNVMGNQPVDTTIEIVDSHNDSHGFVLRDAPVSPGRYRLFWDGIDQKQSQPGSTAWIGAGDYTFHLTTSHAQVHYAGEVNNSTPKYNYQSYGMVDCTSLAMTPTGTTPEPPTDPFYVEDKRVFNTDDSVQLTCVGYDAAQGQWIGADGTLINIKTGSGEMQCGRGLAVTPPDPVDPKNATKQFYFCSTGIGNGDAVVSCSLPANLHIASPKKLTSPDWNRPPAGFVPYKVRLGRLSPDVLGQQHRLFFLTSAYGGAVTHANWIFRNVRLYEDNMASPEPIRFDRSLFVPRARLGARPQPTIPPGSVTVEDGGRSVHFNNAIPVNYPFDYKVTPHTIFAFDLNVIDASGCNLGNGIGLSPEIGSDERDPSNCINFLGQVFDSSSAQFGLIDPSLGAFSYPTYEPNTLHTDSVALPPRGSPAGTGATILWRPGFYGLKVSEDGHLLFACNNADNRLEVRDISTDGHAIAKIPIEAPMYVAWAPNGTEGAPAGIRYVYVDSTTRGILRIPWHVADTKFGRPQVLTSASQFAYPRGLAYSATDHRLFICDSYTLDRRKNANQIVIIDPRTGTVLSRFGKKGGVDPRTGGQIDDHVFTLPLTIDADSKGAVWVNDFYSCEVRKYDFDATTNDLKLERRVLGSNNTNTSHVYWMPDDPPTRAWTVGGCFVRTDSDLDSNGFFINQRTTSTTYNLDPEDQLRPFAHFEKIEGQVYGVVYDRVFQRVGDGWKLLAQFGMNAGDAARRAGLVAPPGEPPTELDKVIAASGDPNWAQRPWAWTDLDGDGRMGYSASNPEFQIAFNSKIAFDGYVPSTCLRPSDAAYVHTTLRGLAVIPPTKFSGKLFYSWQNAKVVPRATDEPASDVIAEDGRYFTLMESAQRHDVGDDIRNRIECYDESGKLLWTRDHDDYSLVCLQPLGAGLISVMDRGGWTTEGPIMIRTTDGDLVCQVYCRRPGDCWSNGALRVDADTAYIGLVQSYKVTGLSTEHSATTTAQLSAAGP